MHGNTIERLTQRAGPTASRTRFSPPPHHTNQPSPPLARAHRRPSSPASRAHSTAHATQRRSSTAHSHPSPTRTTHRASSRQGEQKLPPSPPLHPHSPLASRGPHPDPSPDSSSLRPARPIPPRIRPPSVCFCFLLSFFLFPFVAICSASAPAASVPAGDPPRCSSPSAAGGFAAWEVEVPPPVFTEIHPVLLTLRWRRLLYYWRKQ